MSILGRTKRQPSQLKSIANKLEKTEADISQLKDQILLTAKRFSSFEMHLLRCLNLNSKFFAPSLC